MALRCNLIPSALTNPVVNDRVPRNGLDLEVRTGNVDENSRGMLAGEFDVAEMSMGTFVLARSHGADLVALPIFLGRRFLQPCVAARAGSGIQRPGDVGGRRVVFPQFWMTSSIWHRGLMEHDTGVKSSDVQWLTTGTERMEAPFPPGVAVEKIADWPLLGFFDRVYELTEAGMADAVFFPRSPENRERGGFRYLYGDPVEASLAAYRTRGVYPLMHTIVVRGACAREDRALPQKLRALFEDAKTYAYDHPEEKAPESPIATLSFAEARTHLDGDPYPFGLDANARAIDAFLDYCVEQSVSPTRLDKRDAFAE